ncbi:MAG: NAD(P)/FAD-dependent oxidoreductase [Actinomycetes bacterium]
MVDSAAPTGAPLDVEALREKYRQERDRRIKAPGTDQYTFAEGSFARFADDPYASPLPARQPIVRELDMLIIGTGFGGIECAATLGKAGVDDFLMVDGSSDFGGTWYWNRYPGLRCDIESYIYLPYLEETGYMPTERYVRGQEIFNYCQLLGRHFDLYRRTLFQTKVTAMVWDETAARWIVTTSQGDTLAARFVTTQSGIFDRPQLPGIPGIDSFEGAIFHSARWDYAYTGGDGNGGMTGLRDKRVGVIGTGATGLQIIPELARDAQELVVFQRTPTAVGVRDNGPTDPEWFRSLPEGWHQQRRESFNRLLNLEDVPCDVDDGWARFHRRLIAAEKSVPQDLRTPTEIDAAKERADFEYNEIVRARVDSEVREPAKRNLLKAYYRTMCKRPGFSDGYLPAMDRDNVTLVDVSTGVERITPQGIVVDGTEYALDCIILATGFELGTTWSHRAGYDVVGRGGSTVAEKFARGMRTYHGLFSAGFPNLFFLGLTQGATTTNVPHMLQEQSDHVAYIVARALAEGLTRVEATDEAEAQWQEEIAAVNLARRAFQQTCTPGYFNAEGKAGDDTRSGIASGSYRPSTRFFRMWQDWREAGDFAGLTVS